ncbi:filamentous hemagglutinin N-terminal domain-containing protein [Pseudanabaena sp. lw0831]|uniref:two-partner secretion domain-containing protein n=1 Tax=Pseudanabaena sp. lw0831 TaxID=1357935 RepID=UPI0019158E4A|nr:filamentous hemagglutinin N-terminal domain-containing protein [Pseudanabaena sp. lw0831]
MKQSTSIPLCFLASLCWWVSEYSSINYFAQAQILPDASLPQNSVVTINANIINITGGTRAGNNLFHSFLDFSVATANTAFFNNAIDIQNILTRVTGSSSSQINGILKTNGLANLYLINPNGIVFGADARLDIRGSFVASTANSINFADGSQFSAVNPQASALLTISAPLGLQMGSNPQPISVLGNGGGIRTTSNLIDTSLGLRVDSSQTLALVGGDIAIAGGTLKTAGGNIELGSLGSFGQVQLNSTNQGLKLSYGAATIFQDIRLSGKASVDASGLGSGNIQVRGKNISLIGGSQIQSSTIGNQNGGTLLVKASDKVELTGTSPDLRFASGLVSEIRPNATGNGGNMIVEAAKFFMKDGAVISTNNLGNGIGGDLSIKTSENVEAINSFITATLRGSANGKGGNLIVETAKLSLQRSQISADVQGKGIGGSITIKASESIEAIGAVPNGRDPSGFVISVGRSGEGKAGDIFINTSKLSLQDGAGISSSTFGKGDAGSIWVTALDSVEIIGRSINDRPSSLAARVEDTAQGNGGNITVISDRLVVDRGAIISVSDIAGVKGAGNIQISANFMRLDRSSGVDASTRAGVEGNIFLNTSNLQLFNNSRIQANAFGLATGGNIKIVTDTLVAFENSDITANAQQASGGRITISAAGIFGTAFRRGLTPKNDITASSDLGADFNGVVQLNIFEADPSRSLSRVPIKIDDSSRLIVQRCQADVNQSKFTIAGKGGLPSSPNEVITDSLTHDILGESEPVISSSQSFNPQPEAKLEIVEANNWVIATDGGIALIANKPNTMLRSTNINSLTSCRH